MIDPRIQEFWTMKAVTAGAEHTVNGWGEGSQMARFRAALNLTRPDASDSILDFGCGSARLSDLVGGANYLGIDANEKMLEWARRRRPNLALRKAEVHEVEGVFDHVFALGVWNVKPQSLIDVHDSIERLFADHARKTLTVSVLRSSVGDDVVWDPADIMEIAQGLTDRWAIETRHLPNDLLVTMTK